MAGYNFTDQVRLLLTTAREESRRLGHEYVGTEHLLLGMLSCDDAVAVAVLRKLDVDLDGLRAGIVAALKPGTADAPAADLPYTSRAKKVLELATVEARELGHGYVGTEHLLLGLVREDQAIAAQVLKSHGLTLEGLRPPILELLATGRRDPADPPAAVAVPVTSVIVTVELADGRLSATKFRRPIEAVDYLARLMGHR